MAQAPQDHYATLGILPTAEDIVIRAAYRALAQRYHPDRFAGSPEEANSRMAELNEAYSVLSDPVRRRQYDATRGTGAAQAGFADVSDQAPPGSDPLEKDWAIAVHYYPDLPTFEKRLSQFSWKLANTYRAYVLEGKEFERRANVAETMEKQFLTLYFGQNDHIRDFAKQLILAKQRDAALAVNEAVRVLGTNVDPKRIIPPILKRFGLRSVLFTEKERLKDLLRAVEANPYNTSLCVEVLELLGGEVEIGAGFFIQKSTVVLDGEIHKFDRYAELAAWFRQNVLPAARKLAGMETSA